MTTIQWVFVLMVFAAVFLLAQGLIVPAFGDERRTRRRVQRRLEDIAAAAQTPGIGSLLREKYLKELTPLERWLETLPGMEALGRAIEQSGQSTPAYRVFLAGASIFAATLLVTWSLSGMLPVAVAVALIAGASPFLRIQFRRARRLGRFEEQLPEAIDIMRRALQAGHPFSETLQLVSTELDDPVGREFGITFADLNYGSDLRRAMLGLLERVPSVTVMALVTSVLVQRDTGGNLAEILGKLAAVVRGRFRFQRRVRTLSAEGRLSAWVLALVPFVLFALISAVNPDYLPVLVDDPLGRKLVWTAFGLLMVGILWMRKLIRIEV